MTRTILDDHNLMFCTRENLELLKQSAVWHLDGTFKVSPPIFMQMIIVLGTLKRNASNLSDADVVITLPTIQ